MSLETYYARQAYDDYVSAMAGEDRRYWPVDESILKVLEASNKSINDLVGEVSHAIQQAHRDYAIAVNWMARDSFAILDPDTLYPILAKTGYTFEQFKEHWMAAAETAQLQAKVDELEIALHASEEKVKELEAQVSVDKEQAEIDRLKREEMRQYYERNGVRMA